MKIWGYVKSLALVAGIIFIGILVWSFLKKGDDQAVENLKKSSNKLRERLKNDLEKMSPDESVNSLDNVDDVRGTIEAGKNRGRHQLLDILRRYTNPE